MSAELYRQGKLAESLVEALDVLVEEGKLQGQLALKVMEEVRAAGGAGRRGRWCALGGETGWLPAELPG